MVKVSRRLEVVLGCEWCLDQNNHQGMFGEAFVRVLASAAGLAVAREEPDCTGIDFIMKTTYEIDHDFGRMEVQVKSWSVPVGSDGFWRYRELTEKRFNALAGPRRVPRYLFIVHVPPAIDKYTHIDEDMLRLRHAAYWVSLSDKEKFPEPRCERKVRVMVPQENLLTAEALVKLCSVTS